MLTRIMDENKENHKKLKQKSSQIPENFFRQIFKFV